MEEEIIEEEEEEEEEDDCCVGIWAEGITFTMVDGSLLSSDSLI